MTLRKILQHFEGDAMIPISVRCNSPDEFEEDMLYGRCYYDPITDDLFSADGDSYSLDTEIEKYSVGLLEPYNELIVWINVEWSSGKIYNTMISGRSAAVREGEPL